MSQPTVIETQTDDMAYIEYMDSKMIILDGSFKIEELRVLMVELEKHVAAEEKSNQNDT